MFPFTNPHVTITPWHGRPLQGSHACDAEPSESRPLQWNGLWFHGKFGCFKLQTIRVIVMFSLLLSIVFFTKKNNLFYSCLFVEMWMSFFKTNIVSGSFCYLPNGKVVQIRKWGMVYHLISSRICWSTTLSRKPHGNTMGYESESIRSSARKAMASHPQFHHKWVVPSNYGWCGLALRTLWLRQMRHRLLSIGHGFTVLSGGSQFWPLLRETSGDDVRCADTYYFGVEHIVLCKQGFNRNSQVEERKCHPAIWTCQLMEISLGCPYLSIKRF